MAVGLFVFYSQLIDKSMNITNLTKKSDPKIQEVSRHVLRLCESKLTPKDTMDFRISAYGKLVLDQLLVQYRGIVCYSFLKTYIAHPIVSLPP